MPEVRGKFDTYIEKLEERTINPIDDLKINRSCTATLLLLFAAIDSLSTLTCDKDGYKLFKKNEKHPGSGIRFTSFISNLMGGKYAGRESDLWSLRCSIVHTGFGKKVQITKSNNRDMHLEEDRNGFLWINTNQFFDDLKNAIKTVKIDVKGKGKYYKNAQNRLKDFTMVADDSTDPKSSPGAEEDAF